MTACGTRRDTGKKRARSIAAAGRDFRRRALGGIGVEGLAKGAEVTSGAFYAHFLSKDTAFKQVIAAGVDQLRAGVETLRAEHGAKWIEVFAMISSLECSTCKGSVSPCCGNEWDCPS